jgi:hypothetical protein
VQAFKAVSAGFDSGPASTGALGADSTVTAAAIAAATMTAVVVFSMTAPSFGVLPIGRGGGIKGSKGGRLRVFGTNDRTQKKNSATKSCEIT